MTAEELAEKTWTNMKSLRSWEVLTDHEKTWFIESAAATLKGKKAGLPGLEGWETKCEETLQAEGSQ